jgi:hypothetical protein
VQTPTKLIRGSALGQKSLLKGFFAFKIINQRPEKEVQADDFPSGAAARLNQGQRPRTGGI